MGVPAFFRWLTVRYPKVILDALTEDELEFYEHEFNANKTKKDTNEIPLDEFNSQAMHQVDQERRRQKMNEKIQSNNPEFDNLYLDMNGIIHPCAHPQSGPQPKNEQEMFSNIFEYTDKIMKIVKPKKILYMAIDGVAPRAKQNQQRSRRFRTSLDTDERVKRETELRH